MDGAGVHHSHAPHAPAAFSHSPNVTAADGPLNALTHSLEHTHISSSSHSHVGASPAAAAAAASSSTSAFPPAASSSAVSASVEDGGDAHTGRRTRRKRGPVGGYLAELGPAFKRDLLQSQWFEKVGSSVA